MSQPALKFTATAPVEPAPASVIPLAERGPPAAARIGGALKGVVATIVPPFLTLLAIMVVWQIACGAPESSFPAPLTIWAESKDLILDPFYDNGGVDKGLFWHIVTSLNRVAIGFSFSVVAGVALGVLVGASTWAHRGLDPIFQVLRTVPPLAWLPISLALFREAQPSALFVIFITSIWPILINTSVGVRNIPQDYINVGRVLRLGPSEYFFKILLPAATPYIFTGLRIGVGMSWLAIIASEMLLGGVGIGFFIWDQYNSSRISDIVVALIWVGLVGFALDRFVALIGNLVSRGTAQS